MMITQESDLSPLDIWKSSSGPSLSEIKYARK